MSSFVYLSSSLWAFKRRCDEGNLDLSPLHQGKHFVIGYSLRGEDLSSGSAISLWTLFCALVSSLMVEKEGAIPKLFPQSVELEIGTLQSDKSRFLGNHLTLRNMIHHSRKHLSPVAVCCTLLCTGNVRLDCSCSAMEVHSMKLSMPCS